MLHSLLSPTSGILQKKGHPSKSDLFTRLIPACRKPCCVGMPSFKDPNCFCTNQKNPRHHSRAGTLEIQKCKKYLHLFSSPSYHSNPTPPKPLSIHPAIRSSTPKPFSPLPSVSLLASAPTSPVPSPPSTLPSAAVAKPITPTATTRRTSQHCFPNAHYASSPNLS